MNYSNHAHPQCLACSQPTPPSDITRLSPCNCFPFHAHCISNHERRTREASKTASLHCPICHTRVHSILQSRRYSPPKPRPPFTPSSISHSDRIHPAQPPPASPDFFPPIPPPPPLPDCVLPPPPDAFLYRMQPTAPPPTPPPPKSMPERVLPPCADKIRVYSDLQRPASASHWHTRPIEPGWDSCRFQFTANMNITTARVHSGTLKDRVQPGAAQQAQQMHSQQRRRRTKKKAKHVELYWPQPIVKVWKKLKRMA